MSLPQNFYFCENTISMKKILYILLLSAVVSCGTARQMQTEQNSLEQDSVDLGYGQFFRDNLAFSVSEAKMTEAVENIYMDIFEFLRNNIPGVVVSQTEMVGDVPHIEVRGNRSIFDTQGEPLFLLDGSEYPNIQDLRPEYIHSVQVLSGPSASAYGSRGANGVIMFKSKAAYEAEQAELARRKAERQAKKNK